MNLLFPVSLLASSTRTLEMLIFGGSTEDGRRDRPTRIPGQAALGDTWIMSVPVEELLTLTGDSVSCLWRQFFPYDQNQYPPLSTSTPGPLFGHSTLLRQDCLYIVGGTSNLYKSSVFTSTCYNSTLWMLPLGILPPDYSPCSNFRAAKSADKKYWRKITPSPNPGIRCFCAIRGTLTDFIIK